MRLSKWLALSLLVSTNALAVTTYEVIEPDPLVSIQERLSSVDVKQYLKTPRNEWSVWKGDPYPEATKTQMRHYVPWYTSEFDVKDQHGRVKYPKGFTFNPLTEVKYPVRIVVFKLKHLEKLKPLLRPSDTLIADSGDVVKAAEKLGRHIFLVEPRSRERLGLRVVPSIIEQKGTYFEIKEIAINELD